MLRGEDLRGALVDDSTEPTRDPDLLAGPFAHVVVDEAQELTDAEWRMLLLRCPSRSFTVVGDRASSAATVRIGGSRSPAMSSPSRMVAETAWARPLAEGESRRSSRAVSVAWVMFAP